MKFAFSTLGCPDWSWKEVLTSAKDLGLDGIEVRCIENELYVPNCREFSEEKIARTMERLANAGLTIPVLDSNAVLAVPEKAKASMLEAKAYLNLAARIGTPYVRVMCVDVPQAVDCDLDLCLRLYSELCEYGEAIGVCPLLETNGPLGDSAKMAELMNAVPSANKGVLWDIHHPFRFFDEAPEATFANIAPLLRHVHIKDSVCENGKICYRILGKGDIPVKETLNHLKTAGYDGFVSLEWVKKWNPELDEPGVVFDKFARFVKRTVSE